MGIEYEHNTIPPLKLRAIDTPTDAQVPSYNALQDLFEWVTINSMTTHDKTYHNAPALPDAEVITDAQHGTKTAIPDAHHPSGNIRDSALGLKTGIKAGTNITIDDDAGYAKIAASDATKLNKVPDYDSGWVAIAQDEARAFTHNLGTVEVLVDVQAKDETLGGGIHQIWYGGNTVVTSTLETAYGFYWRNLSTTQIIVYRCAYDLQAQKVRVRLWKTI
jgi:hypothetical protein